MYDSSISDNERNEDELRRRNIYNYNKIHLYNIYYRECSLSDYYESIFVYIIMSPKIISETFA